MVRTRSDRAAASAATPGNGLAAATTGWPVRDNASITPFQPADPANAPWTRTTVGSMFCGPFVGRTTRSPAAAPIEPV
jgi:hypothetical protein